MSELDQLASRLKARDATVGVIGLGYVGLPLVRSMAEAGFRVIGFDVDPTKPQQLFAGQTYIRHLPAEIFTRLIEQGRFEPTDDFDRLNEPDAILICVPTPLTPQREPDLSYVEQTANALRARLRPGQLIILESTTYPGTTRELVIPILERSGLRNQKDFYVAFSPEREDPGNAHFVNSSIPKVVGSDCEPGLEAAVALYDQFVVQTIPVSSLDTAEAVKITENIFRAVNIALVNELKLIYTAMGIDVWEVIEAAKSKPFGFMPFYPGPGLGGHCIPIDPFYLTWKAREYDLPTRFIELAGEINSAMPRVVVTRVVEELSKRSLRSMNGSQILLVGLAYKKNVEDVRGSPGFHLIEMMEARGARVDYFDPYVPVVPATREHAKLNGRKSIELTPAVEAKYDVVVIATDHDDLDYRFILKCAPFVVDTRNIIERSGIRHDGRVCKA